MQQNVNPTSETGISTEVAAKLIKRSVRQFLRIVAAGWIKKVDGKYTIVSVMHGFVDYADDQLRRASATSSKNEAVNARADEIRLKIAIKQKEYSKTDDMIAAIDLLLAKIRDGVAGIPAGFTRDRALRAELQVYVDGVLNRLSDECGRTCENLQAGRIILSPREANDKRRVGAKQSRLPDKRANSRPARAKSNTVQGPRQSSD